MCRCSPTPSTQLPPPAAGNGGTGHPQPQPPAQRRFGEVLAPKREPPLSPILRRRGQTDPQHAPVMPVTAPRPRETSRPEPVAAAGPAGPPPDLRLGEVHAACGAEGAAVVFRIENGSLAGLRVACFLRGDVLDLSLEAPQEEVLARVRSRESDMREALAGRGFELGRFDADGGRHGGEAADGEMRSAAKSGSSRRSARPTGAGGGSRDYVR